MIVTPTPNDGTANTSPLRGEVGAQRRVRGTRPKVSTQSRAKTLRRNQTEAEKTFWNLVRNRKLQGNKFVRQYPVGPFIADFACREAMLIVEMDGGQHDESEGDVRRTRYLNRNGYSVLRFWNNDVLGNLEGCHDALCAVLNHSPSPDLRFAPATLSPEGRGEEGAPEIEDFKE